VKAGLPPDAWWDKANLFSFEAQVFSEGDQKKKK
jgi:AMMECR1 domain-containing protein